MLWIQRTGRRIVSGGVAALLALSAGACSGGGDSSPVDVGPDFGVNDPAVVVAIGDSITFGKHDNGVETCDDSERDRGGFCPVLADLTGKTVINAGICGEDSYGGADRVEDVLREFRPGVLLIDYSPNDLFNGTGALIRNLRTMVTAARNHGSVPILGTLLPAKGEHGGWEPFIEAANIEIRALCAEQGIECADHFQAFASDPAFIQSPYALLDEDGLHPNPAGYDLMARTWRWPLLRVY